MAPFESPPPGSEPADQVNPAVRQVMDEIGIDLSHEFPKKLTTDAVQAADVVITLGCGDIAARVRALLNELLTPSA